jgi:hypothetical protein
LQLVLDPPGDGLGQLRTAASSIFSGCASAIGWALMCSATMNSIRASPTPSVGSIAVWKAMSGLPTLTIRRVCGRANVDKSVRVQLKGSVPA